MLFPLLVALSATMLERSETSWAVPGGARSWSLLLGAGYV